MSRTRVQLSPSWILKTSPYRDTSLLIEALTRTHGRVGLVARGARSARSRLRERLQCFRPLLLSWNESGDLGTLTGAEPDGAAVALGGELIFSGWYLNELLLRLLQRHEQHARVFQEYAEALSSLSRIGEAALRYFEVTLLAETGFGLDLDPDISPQLHYRFLPGRPLVPLNESQSGAFCGSSLIALRERRLFGADQLGDARRLLRAALSDQLGDRALASATMLRGLRQQLNRRVDGQESKSS